MAERSIRSAVLYRQSDINEETLEIVADALHTPTGHAPFKKNKGIRVLSIWAVPTAPTLLAAA